MQFASVLAGSELPESLAYVSRIVAGDARTLVGLSCALLNSARRSPRAPSAHAPRTRPGGAQVPRRRGHE
eukprot:12642057-Alexandrium_andersonii.AAC.1